jgi:hypothetical protein
MSKQLYEEAIADVKKLKEIAEDNAKRAVIEAVAPRIRELIEKELLGESAEEVEEKDDKILTDEPEDNKSHVPEAVEEEVVEALEEPAEEADAKEDSNVEENFEFGGKVLPAVERKLRYVSELANKLLSIELNEKNSEIFTNKVNELSTLVSTMYDFINENADSPTQKLGYNLKLQNCLKKIEKLQEIKMKKRNSRLNEETISLELTGLPDDIDLESLGVNLVSGGEESEEGGEEEESDEEDLDLGDAEGGEEGDEEEESGEEDLDLEGSMDSKMESRKLSDNVIVEIDENMLRREIARMRTLREEKVPSVDGTKPGSDEFDDFGDADSEGEPLDVTLSETDEALETKGSDEEAEDDSEKADESYANELDELALELDMEEAGDRTDSSPAAMKRREDYSQTKKQGDSPGMNEKEEEKDEAAKCESLRRNMAKELKLQEVLKNKARTAASLYESAKTKFSKAKTLAERKEINASSVNFKQAYTNFAKRYNESVKRFNKLSGDLSEALRTERRSNNVAKPVASSGDSQLRNKLAETNLLNAKLIFTNKLLQSEALTARQKSQVIEQLDEAKTLREVKLVYESLAKTLATPRKTVTEGRVLGSSSQATRSASAQTLNEGFESERWAKLAGIAK